MMPHVLTRSLDRSATVFLLVVAGLGVLIPLSNLLLSAGQAEFDSKTRTGDRRPLPGKRMEQVHAKFRGADGLPLGCRLNAGHDFRCGSIF